MRNAIDIDHGRRPPTGGAERERQHIRDKLRETDHAPKPFLDIWSICTTDKNVRSHRVSRCRRHRRPAAVGRRRHRRYCTPTPILQSSTHSTLTGGFGYLPSIMVMSASHHWRWRAKRAGSIHHRHRIGHHHSRTFFFAGDWSLASRRNNNWKSSMIIGTIYRRSHFCIPYPSTTHRMSFR
jgi:hypothetical protein